MPSEQRAGSARFVVSQSGIGISFPEAAPAYQTILTPSQHGLILHDGGRGFVTIAQRVSGSWREHGVRIADLDHFLRHLDPALDSYISQNRFFLPRRRIAYLLQADALFSDLDYYATAFWDHDPRYILDQSLRLLDEVKIPAPTFAAATGRGLALVWLHTPIPRRALPRWKACQAVIFEALKSLGADPNARDAARVLRLVGTRNSRSGTLVEVISGVGEIWDFDTLAREVLPVGRDEIRDRRSKRERTRSRTLRKPAGFNQATLWASRLDDFQKLIIHRHGALQLPSGDRDRLMLLYGTGMSYLVDSSARLRQEMFSLAGDICGWPEHETKSRLASVFSRADAAFSGERIEFSVVTVIPATDTGTPPWSRCSVSARMRCACSIFATWSASKSSANAAESVRRWSAALPEPSLGRLTSPAASRRKSPGRAKASADRHGSGDAPGT